MPIEIRELVIKINVEDSKKKSGLDEKEMQAFKNKVVKECIEKVMANIARMTER